MSPRHTTPGSVQSTETDRWQIRLRPRLHMAVRSRDSMASHRQHHQILHVRSNVATTRPNTTRPHHSFSPTKPSSRRHQTRTNHNVHHPTTVFPTTHEQETAPAQRRPKAKTLTIRHTKHQRHPAPKARTPHAQSKPQMRSRPRNTQSDKQTTSQNLRCADRQQHRRRRSPRCRPRRHTQRLPQIHIIRLLQLQWLPT